MLQVPEADLIEELGLARRELAEALERQAATDEMLRVIASSPGELAPVFQAILANGTRLCEAKFGILYLYQNGEFPIAATHNVPPAFADARRRRPLRSIPGGNVSEAIKTKRPVQLVDWQRPGLMPKGMQRRLRRSNLAAFGPISQYRCSRMTLRLGRSISIARKCVPLQINRSHSSQTSPTKR
jgi:hypothetical protein